MNMHRRSRAWVVALAVAATGMGILPAASSAAPRRGQCATINENINDEVNWMHYYESLGEGYAAAGDSDSANSAFETAGTFATLVDGGYRLLAKLGC